MSAQLGPIILYNEPGVGAMAITGTGSSPSAAYLSDATHLYNGRPADQTAVQWGGGTQSIASSISIQRNWAGLGAGGTTVGVAPSIITLRGVNGVPQGTLATLTLQLVGGGGYATAGGGNTVNLPAHTFPDGSIGWIFIMDAGIAAIQGYQITIYNNVAGSIFITTLAATTYTLLLGETMCYVGWVLPQSIQFDWTFSYDGLPTIRQSANNQPWPLAALPFDKLDVVLCVADYPTTWGVAGNPNGVTYRNISRNLVKGNPCGFVVRTVDTSGALDNWAVHELSIFGTAAPGAPKPLGGDYYELDVAYTAAMPAT